MTLWVHIYFPRYFVEMLQSLGHIIQCNISVTDISVKTITKIKKVLHHVFISIKLIIHEVHIVQNVNYLFFVYAQNKNCAGRILVRKWEYDFKSFLVIVPFKKNNIFYHVVEDRIKILGYTSFSWTFCEQNLRFLL